MSEPIENAKPKVLKEEKPEAKAGKVGSAAVAAIAAGAPVLFGKEWVAILQRYLDVLIGVAEAVKEMEVSVHINLNQSHNHKVSKDGVGHSV